MVNQRSDLGAISRLDNTISNLTNIVENTTASKSHIKDANFAAETSKLTKAQILNQAATAVSSGKCLKTDSVSFTTKLKY